MNAMRLRKSSMRTLGVAFVGWVLAAVPLEAVDRVLIPLDDALWRERIAGAMERLEEGRTREGIEVLQEGLDARSDRLVRVPQTLPRDRRSLLDALSSEEPAADALDFRVAGRRFVPVETLCHVVLSLLSEDELALYRKLYEPRAAELLETFVESGDVVRLARAAQQFFFTPSGVRAAEILGDSLFADGRPREALRWWRRVLDDAPAAPAERLGLRRKMLQTTRAIGDLESHRLLRLELEGASGGRVAADGTDTAARDPATAGARDGDETWLSRGAVPRLPADTYELSWENSLWAGPRRDPPRLPEGFRLPVRTVFPRRGEPLVSFVPLVDEASMYLSGVFSLYRLDAGPDKGAIKTELRKPTPRLLAESPRYEERSDSVLYWTSLWKPAAGAGWRSVRRPAEMPDEVLLTHYVSDRVAGSTFMRYDITVEIPIRSLVAFDLSERRVLWKTGEQELSARARRMQRLFPQSRVGRSPKEALSYTSPAVVRDGLVVAGGWIQRGYVDTLLRAHDLRDGSTVWETFVCGAQLELTMFGEMAREPFGAALLERDGIVYMSTQFGALAAVSLHDGRILWTTTYDTIPVSATTGRKATERSTVWGQNPLVLMDHLLIATPRDSEYLYVVDTGAGPRGERDAGRVLWRYDNGHPGTAFRHLIGARGGWLYFTGPEGVGALRLPDLEVLANDPDAIDAEPAEYLYRPVGDRIGPGALTDRGIVFAAADGLRLLEFRGGVPGPEQTFVSLHDAELAVPARTQVSGGMIYVTTRDRVQAFAPVFPPPDR